MTMTSRSRMLQKETNKMNDWKEISTAPEGIPVLTKIDDYRGARNEQVMTKQGNLWFLESGMYVYYQPTHWKRVEETNK